MIETAGGREVWRADSIKPGGRSNAGGSITLPALPARVLPAGDYVLLLSGARAGGGVEGVGEYSFTVVRS